MTELEELQTSLVPLAPGIPPNTQHPAGDGRPTPNTLSAFAARWGLSPDSERLQTALTHTSAAGSAAQSSERLEFLGDALLSGWVARFLYDHLPPDTLEDTLSRAREQVVRRETLADAGRAIGLPALLRVGYSEQKERRFNHDSLVGDAFEAVTAAIYLDAGVNAMDAFLRQALAGPLAAVVARPPAPNPKTALQEHLQAAGRGIPIYVTLQAEGDGHDHHFVVEVRDRAGATLGQGEGTTKRIAQMTAAARALTLLSTS